MAYREKMPSAAIVIADGFTDAEFLVAYHMFKAECFDVEVYSLNGGSVTGVCGWVHKKSNTILDSYEEFYSRYNLLALVGGVKAIEKLRLCAPLIKWIRSHDAAGKAIATICHGAQLLIEADIVRGRKVLGYNSIRKDLENAGAVWPEGQEVWVDRNIVSARHYDFAGIWMREVLRVWRERGAQ